MALHVRVCIGRRLLGQIVFGGDCNSLYAPCWLHACCAVRRVRAATFHNRFIFKSMVVRRSAFLPVMRLQKEFDEAQTSGENEGFSVDLVNGDILTWGYSHVVDFVSLPHFCFACFAIINLLPSDTTDGHAPRHGF